MQHSISTEPTGMKKKRIQTFSLFYLNGTESLLVLLGTPVLTYLFRSKMAAVIKDSTFFTKAKKCKNMTALVFILHFCGTVERRHDTSLLLLVDIKTIFTELRRIAVHWKNAKWHLTTLDRWLDFVSQLNGPIFSH